MNDTHDGNRGLSRKMFYQSRASGGGGLVSMEALIPGNALPKLGGLDGVQDPLLLQEEIDELGDMCTRLQGQISLTAEQKTKDHLFEQLQSFSEKANKKRIDLMNSLRVLKDKTTRSLALFSASDVEEHLATVPNYPIFRVNKTKAALVHISGPGEAGLPLSHGSVICGHTISTYPMLGGARAGDPICDRYEGYLLDKSAVLVVADGCNWGERPRDAAVIASHALNLFLRVNLERYSSIHQIARGLMKGFSLAQSEILASKEDPLDAGTTTLIGCVVVPLKRELPLGTKVLLRFELTK